MIESLRSAGRQRTSKSTELRARVVRTVVGACALVAIAARSSAQCLEWASGFVTPGGVGVDNSVANDPRAIGARVYASAVFDDGNGLALYVGGRFTHIAGIAANGIAKWDGTTWSDLGTGFLSGNPDTTVNALQVFDDGSGPALYVAGNLRDPNQPGMFGVMRWDGSQWSSVGAGMGSFVGRCLAVYDYGNGPELYVGGYSQSILRWNGGSWTALDPHFGLLSSNNPDPGIKAFQVFDSGSGPELFFTHNYLGAAGTLPNSGSTGITKFNGTNFVPVGWFATANITAMTVFDDGGGEALYLAGPLDPNPGAQGFPFDSPLYYGVKKWDGSQLSDVGSVQSVVYSVTALDVYIDPAGGGRRLYAGGLFPALGGTTARGIARWDGSTWSAVGDGLGSGYVYTLAKFNGRIYAGGSFGESGTKALNGVSVWDGASWSAFGSGDGVAGRIVDLAVHDDGTGPALYAAGDFKCAGDLGTLLVAKWNGTSWAPLADAHALYEGGRINALVSYDDGSGSKLYMQGSGFILGVPGFPSAMTWDGTSLSASSAPLSSDATGNVVYDPPGPEGPALYSCSSQALTVNRWDGTTTSVIGNANGLLGAMCVYDDGTGPKLVIGGQFTLISGLTISGSASWDGTHWSPVGVGPGPVEAFATFHDGSGGPAALYAGVGASSSTRRIRRFDGTVGTVWTTIGETEPGGRIYDMIVFGDGTPEGAALYVAGKFTSIDGVSMANLARWDGSAWSAVTGGANRTVRALCAFRDGTDSAPDLYLGGDFSEVGGVTSLGIAKLQGCSGPGTPFCFADGTLATDCPCAPPYTVPNPQGSAFGGCANSFNLQGASLTAVGTTNPDTVTLHATGLTPVGFTVFIKSNASDPSGFASYDGVRCTAGAFIRFGGQFAVGGTARYPNPALGLTLPLSVVSGTPPGSGLSAYYQPFYRNVNPSFCGAGTLNHTNAYGLLWN